MAKQAKKGAKKKPNAKKRARKPAPPAMSAADRAVLLKAGDDTDEFLQEVADAWRQVPRKLRVEGLSPAKLESLARKWTKAVRKEQALTTAYQAKLAPLMDARMRIGDTAKRAGLNVKRVADALAAADAQVEQAFAAVTERFRRGSAPTPPES